MLDLSKTTHERFETCLNQRFLIEVESSAPIELELVAVEVETRRRREPPADKRQAFSLLFRGPKNPGLEQRIFALTNETLGSLELFLVPVGPDEVGMLYEAVFT